MTPTNVGSLDPRFMLARARMVIAREVLDAESCPATVGQIALHAHQRRAAARILTLLRAYGGALLADATGLGKTFVALAVADTLERILIIAPASLRDGWRRSAALAGIQASFVSLERLSRGIASPVRDPELVIVDEAHHLRNPRTKRYSAVAALCDRARVLLLSATPLQNRRNDLVAQLALFSAMTRFPRLMRSWRATSCAVARPTPRYTCPPFTDQNGSAYQMMTTCSMS